MRKFWKFLTGGLLILIGCGLFLYPDIREWITQKKVDRLEESFEILREEADDEKGREEDPEETESDNGNRDPPAETESRENTETATEETAQAKTTVFSGDETETETREPVTENTAALAADYSVFPELYQAMVNYNADLDINGQKITDAWSYEQTPVEFPDLDTGDPVIGYISIPDMDVRLPLYVGASTDNLKKGAAVLSGTSMPVGGENTNCVIAAHRGWHGSAYFQYIEDLGPGSMVYITTPWETLTYRYRDYMIIGPDDISSILIQDGKDMITLFTCHPYQVGGGPYRYLVFCDRVTATETADTGEDAGEILKADSVEQETDTETQETVKATVMPEESGTGSSAQETMAEAVKTVQDKTSAESASTGTAKEPESSGIDMLAMEQTLRVILPAAVILFAVVMVLAGRGKALKRKAAGKNKKKLSAAYKKHHKKGSTGIRLPDKKPKRKKKKEEGSSRRT